MDIICPENFEEFIFEVIFFLFRFAREDSYPDQNVCVQRLTSQNFFMSCYKSQAPGQSKEALEEKLFYAFPAAKSSNISCGSGVFILEFLPSRDNRTLLFQLWKGYYKHSLQTQIPHLTSFCSHSAKCFFLTIIRIDDSVGDKISDKVFRKLWKSLGAFTVLLDVKQN